MTDNRRARGIALAVAVAGLFAATPFAAVAHSDDEDGHAHGDEPNGKCIGGNACRGQSACKTSASQCAGQNACKGQGFTSTTAKDCEASGGRFTAD